MLIDSHCHLDFPDFAEERDEIIARAHAAGVRQIVTISTRVRKLQTLLDIAERYDSVFCSVGTHPNNADEELDIKTPHGIKTRRFGPPQQACILSMSRGDEEEAMQTDTAREVVILSTSQFSRAYKE